MAARDGHVIVVGGGIVGVCAAYFLARRGVRVTLLERRAFGDSASCGNAGLVALGHWPLPRPGLARNALRWMLDPGSPLYISPRPDLALVRWLFGFRRACAPEQFRRNMDLLAEHGWHAGRCFRALVEEEALACEYSASGWRNIFLTEEGMRHGEREAAMVRGYGYDVEMMDGDRLRDHEPAFRDEVLGAAHYKDSAFANPRAFLLEMVERARARGVLIEAGEGVRELIVEHGRCTGVLTSRGVRLGAGTVLLAAGIWSRDLARRVGVAVPMQPGKGYHVNLTAPRTNLRVASVLSETFVAATPIGGGLRLAGTLEFSGINDRIVGRRVEMLKRGARRYLYGMEETREISRWCGLRPCTADGLPVIGWAPRTPGLFVATGHAMMGFALGPLAARLAAECIVDGEPSLDLGALGPERFAS